MAALKQDYFGEISERFVAALQRVLPERDEYELALGFQFLVGIMVQVIAGRIETIVGDVRPDANEGEPMLARIIRFAAAGFEA